MTSNARSTIAALCYANKVDLNFKSLTRELGDALSLGLAGPCRIEAEYDDFAVFDLETARICLGYCDFSAQAEAGVTRVFPDHAPAECLIVSVGAGPECRAPDTLYENRDDLCRGLAHQIDEVEPSDRIVYLDRGGIVTADILDEVIDLVHGLSIHEPAGDTAPPETAADGAPNDPACDIAPDPVEPPVDAARTPGPKTECAAPSSRPALLPPRPTRSERRAGRPSRPASTRCRLWPAVLPRTDQPAKRPVLPRVPLSAGRRLRKGDYTATELWEVREMAHLRDTVFAPTEEEQAEEALAKSLGRRIAIYTINTGVIMLSAPIGVAALTYCALGRENARVAAHAMAVTGMITGLANAGFGGAILGYIV